MEYDMMSTNMSTVNYQSPVVLACFGQALSATGRAQNPFRRGKLSGHSTIPDTSQAVTEPQENPDR